MRFGQRYDGNGRISKHADYVQLNICGLSAIDIVQRYFLYEIDKPIILFGDYTSKVRNAREDDMLNAERIYEIKDAITSLKAFGAEILALTVNPVSRQGLSEFGGVKDISFKEFVDKLIDIYQIPVLVKNSQCKSLFLSTIEEIIEFSYTNKITLDSMLLYEICEYNRDKYLDTLSKMNMNNVREIYVNNKIVDGKELLGHRDIKNLEMFKSVVHVFENVPCTTFVFSDSNDHLKFDSIITRIFNAVEGNDRD